MRKTAPPLPKSPTNLALAVAERNPSVDIHHQVLINAAAVQVKLGRKVRFSPHNESGAMSILPKRLF